MANSDKLFKSFTCPIGNCGENIIEDPAKISEHLRHSHRGTSMQMNLYQDPSNVAFFCHHCNRYLRRLHFHCTECEKTHAVTNQTVNTFPNKKALDEHRITHPEKWFLERCCTHIEHNNGKRIITCHGWKSGACGFNHMHHENNFVMSDALPSWLCRYENLKENTRCLRVKCSFEHLWGRVRFNIKTMKVVVAAETTENNAVIVAEATASEVTNCSDVTVAEATNCSDVAVADATASEVTKCDDVTTSEVTNCSDVAVTHHEKWFLEEQCRNHNKHNTCRGSKSGACRFNHMHPEDNFVMSNALPSWLCRYENLNENMRCLRDKCSFEHLRGYVYNVKTMKVVVAAEATTGADNTEATDKVAPSTPERHPSGECPGAPKKHRERK
jgi:hypothetical protein